MIEYVLLAFFSQLITFI